MTDFKITAMIDTFKLGLREGILKKARDIGAIPETTFSAVRFTPDSRNLYSGCAYVPGFFNAFPEAQFEGIDHYPDFEVSHVFYPPWQSWLC